MFLPRFALAPLLALLAWGQDPPPVSPGAPAGNPAPRVFEYAGKPLSRTLECDEEDLRSAGLACTEDEPCAMFLEITSVEGLGNKLIATGNVHSSSVTLQSILLVSDDAGHTWREAAD